MAVQDGDHLRQEAGATGTGHDDFEAFERADFEFLFYRAIVDCP